MPVTVTSRDLSGIMVNLKRALAGFEEAYTVAKKSGSVEHFREYEACRGILITEIQEASDVVSLAARRGFDTKIIDDKAREADNKLLMKILVEPVEVVSSTDNQVGDGNGEGES